MPALSRPLISHRTRITSPTTIARRWNPLALALLASLWMAAFANWPLWHALIALPEMTTLRGAVTLVGFFIMVAALIFFLLAPLAWRWSIKPAIALFLLSAASGAYFMGAYGVVIDSTMMLNVLR